MVLSSLNHQIKRFIQENKRESFKHKLMHVSKAAVFLAERRQILSYATIGSRAWSYTVRDTP